MYEIIKQQALCEIIEGEVKTVAAKREVIGRFSTKKTARRRFVLYEKLERNFYEPDNNGYLPSDVSNCEFFTPIRDNLYLHSFIWIQKV